MPRTRTQKQHILQSVEEKLSRAKSLVFADYKGLNTAQLTVLRKKLKETNAEFTVVKNTLLQKALSKRLSVKGKGSLPFSLEGPTAVLLAYQDEIAPLKALANFAKTSGLPAIKGGFFNQVMHGAQKITELALLPSREVLQAKVVQTMVAPLHRLLAALQWNQRQLVYTLEAIRGESKKMTNFKTHPFDKL